MLIEVWRGGAQLVPSSWQSIPARASRLLGSNPEGKTFLTPLPNPYSYSPQGFFSPC